jgi:HPt (histidine-containing phosphotransfer) domain-containing protein
MTASEQTTGVLDSAALENLKDMIGGDTEFFADLIDTFIADAPRMLADMRQGMEGGDVALLHRAAHSLKSNSADFGALTLSELCRELEARGKDGVLAGAAELIERVEAEYAKAETALKAIRQDL